MRLDAQLTALAQAQADAMAAADQVSHDVKGPFAMRLAASGVHAGEAGENVCAGYYSTADAMAAWRRVAGTRRQSADALGDPLRRRARQEPAQPLGRLLGDGDRLAGPAGLMSRYARGCADL